MKVCSSCGDSSAPGIQVGAASSTGARTGESTRRSRGRVAVRVSDENNLEVSAESTRGDAAGVGADESGPFRPEWHCRAQVRMRNRVRSLGARLLPSFVLRGVPGASAETTLRAVTPEMSWGIAGGGTRAVLRDVVPALIV